MRIPIRNPRNATEPSTTYMDHNMDVNLILCEKAKSILALV